MKYSEACYRKLASWIRYSGHFEKAIFAALILAFSFNYFSQTSDPYKYFNLDALTIHAFVDDLLRFNGHISAWHFSNAPSFFPDYVIGLAAGLSGSNFYWRIFFSSLIQVRLLYYVVRRLATPFLEGSAAGYSLLILITILLLASKDISPYYQVLILNWHFGTYLIGLYYFLIYVELVAKNGLLKDHFILQSHYLSITLLSGLSFLMTLSDGLFAVLFPGPLLLVGCYYLAIKRLSKAQFGLLFGLPFISTLIANGAAPWIVPNHAGLSLQFSATENYLAKIFEIYRLLNQVGFSALFFALFFGWCMTQIPAILRQGSIASNRTELEEAKVMIAAFVTLSLFSSLVVIVGSNALVGDRYLASLFFTPFVFAFLLPTRLFREGMAIKIALAILLAAFLQNSYSHRSLPLKSNFYPEQIACIDNATRKLAGPSGIGEYWLTKKLVAFSQNGVRMVSVNPDLTPYDVLISNDWYKPRYNFAVINTAEPANSMYLLDERLIEAFNGKPDATAYCANAKILLYEHGLSTAMDPVRGTGRYSVQGCHLPHSTGTAKEGGACSLQSRDLKYVGNFSYGPYFKLPVGTYEFDINYISGNPVDLPIGHIDISFLLPEKHQIVTEYKWVGSGAQDGHLKGIVEVDSEHARGQLEIRTFIENQTEVEILSIGVSRVKTIP